MECTDLPFHQVRDGFKKLKIQPFKAPRGEGSIHFYVKKKIRLPLTHGLRILYRRKRPEDVEFELGTLSEGTMHGIAREQSKSTVQMQCLPLFRFVELLPNLSNQQYFLPQPHFGTWKPSS